MFFCAQKKRLIEMVLLSTHIICFLVESLENYFSVTHSFMLVCAIIILEIQLFEAFSRSFLATK